MILNTLRDEIRSLGGKKLKEEPTISFNEFEHFLYANAPTLHLEQRVKAFQLGDDLLSLTHEKAEPASHYPIVIVGAGSAGLLYAYYFGRLGYPVTVYEKRNQQTYNLRYPNISFKEGDTTLKAIVGNPIYQRFLEQGGSMDGKSGKLRLTIGSFQDTLLEAIQVMPNVTLHFDHAFDFNQSTDYSDAHIVLLATGCHAAERFGILDDLEIKRFSEFDVKGQSALYVRDANEHEHGYWRTDIEGFHWRRDNQSIYSGKAFTSDLLRLTRQIDDKSMCSQLEALCRSNSVEYTFSFGNATEKFFENPPCAERPVRTAEFEVKPQISLNPFIDVKGKSVIAIGDANGTPHPLAAIGTLKFIRNVKHLDDYLIRERSIAKQAIAKQETLHQLNRTSYQAQALKNIQEVFCSNLISAVYSWPR